MNSSIYPFFESLMEFNFFKPFSLLQYLTLFWRAFYNEERIHRCHFFSISSPLNTIFLIHFHTSHFVFFREPLKWINLLYANILNPINTSLKWSPLREEIYSAAGGASPLQSVNKSNRFTRNAQISFNPILVTFLMMFWWIFPGFFEVRLMDQKLHFF